MVDMKETVGLVETALQSNDATQLAAIMAITLVQNGYGHFEGAQSIDDGASSMLLTLPDGKFLSCKIEILDKRPVMGELQ